MIDLKQLQNLNGKDPGSWPWLVKITSFVFIILLIVGGGFYFLWQDQWNQLDGMKQEEAKLKEEFLNKKKVAINLDLIKKQLSETQESFGALLKQLPSKSEMDALLTDINQAGLGRGLQFDLFKPSPEVINGAFAEQPIAIKVSGNYDDFGRFASDISMLPRIVTLTDINIVAPQALGPGGANVGMLSMETTAKTFRYLDETELEANAQKDKKDKKAAAGATK